MLGISKIFCLVFKNLYQFNFSSL